MIISASRRTDIPAFYGDWMMERLQAGYVLVKNPMNPKQVSRISLRKDVVDCIVFWTKNPQPFLNQLPQLQRLGYMYYFHVTITPYGRNIEPSLPTKHSVVESCKRLSEAIGPERVIWRYDPIIINSELTVDYHLNAFAELAKTMDGYVEQCVFSFYDDYRKVRQRMKSIAPRQPNEREVIELINGMATIARQQTIHLSTCCEVDQTSEFGIPQAACIDQGLIERLVGMPLRVNKDRNQRAACKCIESIDIGHYDSCAHGCLYCYGTLNRDHVQSNLISHHDQSPLLIGQVDSEMTVKERKVESLQIRQTTLF